MLFFGSYIFQNDECSQKLIYFAYKSANLRVGKGKLYHFCEQNRDHGEISKRENSTYE
jgi:hypothetical protein